MKKILRINLDNQTYAYEEVCPEYLHLGGRALTSKIIATEVNPKADPLGRDNKLVFACGLLGGTAVPNSGRFSVGTKSPLTHTMKEANAGGTAAIKMARLNIIAIIFEGQAKELINIHIDKDDVIFHKADAYHLLGTYATYAKAQEEFGAGKSVVANGPAGEKQLLSSGIFVSSPEYFPRAAGRGGVGAVMGSKNLKAVIIDDKGSKLEAAVDPETLKAAAKEYAQILIADPGTEGNKQLGTGGLVNFVNSFGGLITKNFTQGQWDKAEKISGESLVALINSRPNGHAIHRCMPGCLIQCSNVLPDEEGNIITSGLEYETLALVGSNCLIDDLDVIGRINDICNDYGLDTMDVGTALGVAMENGVIEWGDGPAAIKLVEDCIKGGDAEMIGHGCQYTGDKLGAKRIPTVKGQSLSGYDPRAVKGTGVTYATSTMGADHTCGNALPMPGYDSTSPEGQAQMSGFLQNHFCGLDSFGMCLFSGLVAIGNENARKLLTKAYVALTGADVPEDYLHALGAQTVDLEYQFNKAVGFTNEDDRLPAFFTTEVLESTGQVFDVSPADLDSVHNHVTA